jgi:hypothetical protein
MCGKNRDRVPKRRIVYLFRRAAPRRPDANGVPAIDIDGVDPAEEDRCPEGDA